jgi:hypothetical protein
MQGLHKYTAVSGCVVHSSIMLVKIKCYTVLIMM